MADAVVGAVIMVIATTSLLLAVDISTRAYNEAGTYPLTSDEEQVLNSAGLTDRRDQNQFWLDNLQKLN